MPQILRISIVLFYCLEGITGKDVTGFVSGLGPGHGRPAGKVLITLFLSLKIFLDVGLLTAEAPAYSPPPMSNFLNRNEMSCVKISSSERDQYVLEPSSRTPVTCETS